MRTVTGAQRGPGAGWGRRVTEGGGSGPGPWGPAEQRAGEGRYFRQEETRGSEEALDAHGWVSTGSEDGGEAPHATTPPGLPLPHCGLAVGPFPRPSPLPLWSQGSDNPSLGLISPEQVVILE